MKNAKIENFNSNARYARNIVNWKLLWLFIASLIPSIHCGAPTKKEFRLKNWSLTREDPWSEELSSTYCLHTAASALYYILFYCCYRVRSERRSKSFTTVLRLLGCKFDKNPFYCLSGDRISISYFLLFVHTLVCAKNEQPESPFSMEFSCKKYHLYFYVHMLWNLNSRIVLNCDYFDHYFIN